MRGSKYINFVSTRLGTAAMSVPGVLRAAITGTINFAGDVRQSNLIGAAIAGVINVAADITLSAGAQVGAAVSGTISLASGLVQTNLVGATMSGTISFAGNIASASAWDYDAEYMLNF